MRIVVGKSNEVTGKEFIIKNADRVPFRDMPEADQIAVLKAKLNAPESVDWHNGGCWNDAEYASIEFSNVYRVRAANTPLVLPWEVIRPEYNWSVMQSTGAVVLAESEEDFKLNSTEWAFNWGKCFVISSFLVVDTHGIVWDRSKTRRPV